MRISKDLRLALLVLLTVVLASTLVGDPAASRARDRTAPSPPPPEVLSAVHAALPDGDPDDASLLCRRQSGRTECSEVEAPLPGGTEIVIPAVLRPIGRCGFRSA